MPKLGRIALAVSLSLTSIFLFAETLPHKTDNLENVHLPILQPESQHVTASKRIVAQYTRSHYKPVTMNDHLSEEIFDRYIKQLDYSRNIFLATDIKELEKYRDDFDDEISRGKLQVPYKIYNLNMQRRLERYQYAISLLKKPIDFTLDEVYNFDREEAAWPIDEAELDNLWRLKVKYDALNLTLAGKKWPKVQEILTKRYHYAIKRLSQGESEDAFQLLMNSFSRVLDPHTSYLSPRNAEKFQMEMNLSLEGIGAVLRAKDDYTTILSVVPGGPADKSKKLKPNDRIVGVSQDEDEFVDVIGWRLDDVVDLIKGPKGTKVRLQVLPSESDDDASVKIVSIIRDKIKLEDRRAKAEVYFDKDNSNKDSSAKNNNNEHARKLGVITIPSFYNNLSVDVKKELLKLEKDNVEGVVIDLRGNGGGSLNEATLLTGLFIDKGPVVQIRNGANRIAVNRDQDGVEYYNGPLTVLVDRYSASASEIFAAAIQDYGRGVIIGEHTYGKGTVQQHRPLGRIYDLFDHPLGSIQYTIAKFYRISGGSTQKKGVMPDIAFPTAVDAKDWGESKEEYALPWDQIRKANYQKLTNLTTDITQLDSLYKERIKNSREFNYLLDDIKEYKQEKDDKTVSLNIDVRKAKREENKAKRLTRVNERLVVLGKAQVKSVDDLSDELTKQLAKVDPFLDEAAEITFDLSSLGKYAKK